MTARYLIVGAAGHAQEVAWSLREQLAAAGQSGELLFFDDQPLPQPASKLGELVGRLDDLASYAGTDAALVMGIGLPRTKATVARRLAKLDLRWTTVVHPRAIIGPNVELGEGTYVAAGAIVTLNVRVGRLATLNMHTQAAHDDVLGDFATLHPDAHLAGNVRLGEGCEIGAGALVIPGITIGDWAVLGAGCIAISDLDGGRTYVGVPARATARARKQAGSGR